jgi:hypothetical protein
MVSMGMTEILENCNVNVRFSIINMILGLIVLTAKQSNDPRICFTTPIPPKKFVI